MGFSTTFTMVFEGPRWWRPLVRMLEGELEEIPLRWRQRLPELRLPDGERVRLPMRDLEQGSGVRLGNAYRDYPQRVRGMFAFSFSGNFDLTLAGSASHTVLVLETVTKRQASAYSHGIPAEHVLHTLLACEAGVLGLHSFELDYWYDDGDEPHDNLFWYDAERVQRALDASEGGDARLIELCRRARAHHDAGWYLQGAREALSAWRACRGEDQEKRSLGSLGGLWPEHPQEPDCGPGGEPLRTEAVSAAR